MLSLVQNQFLGRRANLWTKLGRAKPVKEISLADTVAMVCTAGMDTMGLLKEMLGKTMIVLRWVKRFMLTMLGAVAVEISKVESHIGGVKAVCGCFGRS